MSAIPLRPLDFGEVLDLAFGLFRRDFRLYMPLALVGLVPATVAIAIPGSGDPEVIASDLGTALQFFGLMGVGLLFSLLTWAALTTAMDARMSDRPASIGGSYARALALLPRLSVAAFLAALILGLALFAMLIPAVFVVMMMRGSLGGAILGAAMTGGVMLAAGGWWATHTYMLVPAAVVEDRGPVRALRRCFGLVRGSRWRVFFVVAVTWVMAMVPGVAASAVTGSAGAIFQSNPAEAMGLVR